MDTIGSKKKRNFFFIDIIHDACCRVGLFCIKLVIVTLSSIIFVDTNFLNHSKEFGRPWFSAKSGL